MRGLLRAAPAALVLAAGLAACGSPGSGPENSAPSAGPAGPAATEGASPSGTEAAAAEDAAKPAPGEATSWEMPVPALAYNAREGRALFDHYCATCHGSEGHGDGLNAYNLDPKPRDLGEAAFQKDRSDEDLAAVIRSGGGVAGLSTGMPPWGRTLGDRKIRNIVTYIRTFSPEDS